jgi:cytochrome P450
MMSGIVGDRAVGDEVGEIRYDPADPTTMRDPFATYQRLRDEAPVHHLADKDTHVISRFDDVWAAARDTETFSSAQGLTWERDEIAQLGLVPTMVMVDPPLHTTFRRLVGRGFTPRQVATLEPEVRRFTVERLEALRDAGSGDLVDALAGPLPSFVVATYLGVPDEDRARFDGWSNAIVAANAGGDVLRDAAGAVADLYGYFGELVERRRVEPGHDMISGLLAAEIDGDPIDLVTILGYAFVMIAGGNDTTTGLLGGSAVLLTEHPDQRARLLDAPERIPGAVDELLRLTSPVQGLGRTTTRDVVVAGTEIAEGSKVHLPYAAANRDPREFGPSAEHLDVGRSIPRLLTFGSGAHFCLGASAARLMGRVALEELLRLMPDFSVDATAGVYAPGAFVRRHQSLPITAG